jgi:putative addiction module killer protein
MTCKLLSDFNTLKEHYLNKSMSEDWQADTNTFQTHLRIGKDSGYRVYFQRKGNEIIILLCGGDKSTQAKDIKAAKRLADEWS